MAYVTACKAANRIELQLMRDNPETVKDWFATSKYKSMCAWTKRRLSDV